MRLLPLNRVPDDAELGRDVASGRADGMPLLRAGSRINPRYRRALEAAGIHAVYIRDAVSDGIEPQTLLSQETRAAAFQAVTGVSSQVRDALNGGRPLPAAAVDSLQDVVAAMLSEVEEASEMAMALGDLTSVDSYTMKHSVDVTALGLLIGQRMFRDRGWTDSRGRRTFEGVHTRLTRLGLGLLLHDIGKLTIPLEVLNKPGRLDPAEWELMRTHPMAGVEILSSDLISPLVKAVVRWHHERWNGSGYPDGRVGFDINQLARIAAVADVYDAITSERVYAPAKPASIGVKVILNGSGTDFDPEIVEAFKRIVPPFPPGVEVKLTDGSRALVVAVPRAAMDRPVVRVTHAADGRPVRPYEIALDRHPSLSVDGWEEAEKAA